jgi:hypothetical protein
MLRPKRASAGPPVKGGRISSKVLNGALELPRRLLSSRGSPVSSGTERGQKADISRFEPHFRVLKADKRG